QVTSAAHGARVQPNTVHVIPPNAELTIAGGVLQLSKPAATRMQRRPIDTFFASLAEDQRERAICVILSGAGSDGSEGLKAIKEHGGLSLAQADFDSHALIGMPSSAAATGLVDDVMPVEQMPKRLIEYAKHHAEIKSRGKLDGARQEVAGAIPRICAVMRRTLGHDFSEYKPNTLIRRIQRRMSVFGLYSLKSWPRVRRITAQILGIAPATSCRAPSNLPRDLISAWCFAYSISRFGICSTGITSSTSPVAAALLGMPIRA